MSDARSTPLKLLAAGLLPLMSLVACSQTLYYPDQATRPYPVELHEPRSVDIQVFRDGTSIDIVNATATGYQDFDLWLNQRYVAHLDDLPAGGSREISLWEFFDERGEQFSAGGLFRTREPTPLRLVQIQIDDVQPMIGLITILTDDDT